MLMPGAFVNYIHHIECSIDYSSNWQDLYQQENYNQILNNGCHFNEYWLVTIFKQNLVDISTSIIAICLFNWSGVISNCKSLPFVTLSWDCNFSMPFSSLTVKQITFLSSLQPRPTIQRRPSPLYATPVLMTTLPLILLTPIPKLKVVAITNAVLSINSCWLSYFSVLAILLW